MGTVPTTYNFADVWEMAADAVPEREALVVGDERRTYAALEERANRLAHHLAARGVGPGDHVALYLENCPEYVEAMLAAFKLRAVPINVNHRYVAGELRYLLDNSDAVAVLTQPSLGATVAAVAGEVPAVRFVLEVGDAYEAALAAAPADRPAVPGRGDDDRYIIYTGGTTGLPKGVEWRHADAFFACFGGGDPSRVSGAVSRPEELPDRIVESPLCYLPLAPMMHAAAQWTSFAWFFAGGKVVLMPGSLDPEAVWSAVAAEGVNLLTVVGDAVARPLLDAWDRAGGYDVPSLFSVSNGGAPDGPRHPGAHLRHPPRRHGGRRVRVVRGGHAGRHAGAGRAGHGRGEPRPLQPADQAHRGDRPGRGRGGARVRRGRPGPGRRAPAGRLLQRPRAHRGDVRRARRRAVADHRRHGHRRRGRGHRAAGPGLAAPSTPGARRCSPRRSRASSRPTRRCTTASSSGCPTSAGGAR